jgi:hypothetical protein
MAYEQALMVDMTNVAATESLASAAAVVADLADCQDWGACDTLAWARCHSARAASAARVIGAAIL